MLLELKRVANMRIFKKGFSLIEVMVTVIILVAISVIAVAIFRSLSVPNKLTKGKSDVKAMAAALELKYNQPNGYQLFSGNDFAAGAEPTPPLGAHYTVLLSNGGSGFRICSNFYQPTVCTRSDNCYCFCVDSAQGAFDESDPTPFIYEP